MQLAIASLKAAQGETQTFKKEPWFVVQDYDYDLAGLEFDESADIYLSKPASPNRVKRFLFQLCGMLFLLGIAAIFGLGLLTSINWLLKR